MELNKIKFEQEFLSVINISEEILAVFQEENQIKQYFEIALMLY